MKNRRDTALPCPSFWAVILSVPLAVILSEAKDPPVRSKNLRLTPCLSRKTLRAYAFPCVFRRLRNRGPACICPRQRQGLCHPERSITTRGKHHDARVACDVPGLSATIPGLPERVEGSSPVRRKKFFDFVRFTHYASLKGLGGVPPPSQNDRMWCHPERSGEAA